MLVGMNQVMMSPTIGVESYVPGGAKLGQLILPLLLQIQVAIYDHLANLIAYSHTPSFSRLLRPRPPT